MRSIPPIRAGFRRVRRLAMALLAGIAALPALGGVRSPLSEASAIQQQLRIVAERSARSIYAVTAFTVAPGDAALYAGGIDGKTFAAIAEKYERSCGTAFAIDNAGRLLTNEHVVASAGSVWVTDDVGRVFPALVVGTDPRGDLAVLSIPSDTVPLPFASADPARGDLVLTMGNPDGQATGGSLCASVGTVSVADRSLPALSERERRNYAHMIQTTAPIEVGSSGGPLLDLKGDVLGVVCAVATASDKPGRPPISFATSLALPATRGRVALLTRGEEVVYGYLGVMVGPPGEAIGARVDRVDADTPAYGVLREGDIVLRLDGRPIRTDRAFIELAGACRVDEDVPLTIRRGEAELDLTIRPRRRVLSATPVTRDSQRFTWAGVTFANADRAVRVAEVAAEAADFPLKAGDAIGLVNGDAVHDLAGLLRLLHHHAGQPLHLDNAPRVTRNGGTTDKHR